jgi:hypothetical protein
MKIHLHASFPLYPSIFPIAEASNPPKALASVVEMKKKLKRF